MPHHAHWIYLTFASLAFGCGLEEEESPQGSDEEVEQAQEADFVFVPPDVPIPVYSPPVDTSNLGGDLIYTPPPVESGSSVHVPPPQYSPPPVPDPTRVESIGSTYSPWGGSSYSPLPLPFNIPGLEPGVPRYSLPSVDLPSYSPPSVSGLDGILNGWGIGTGFGVSFPRDTHDNAQNERHYRPYTLSAPVSPAHAEAAGLLGNSIKCDGNLASCVEKCVAQKMYCWATQAAHPYTDTGKGCYMGDLERCSEGPIPANVNGVYTCSYRYPNGDYCSFKYGLKGPRSPVIACRYFYHEDYPH